jgi:hypothetical protein
MGMEIAHFSNRRKLMITNFYFSLVMIEQCLRGSRSRRERLISAAHEGRHAVCGILVKRNDYLRKR